MGDLMLGRHSVDNQVHLSSLSSHRCVVTRDDESIGTLLLGKVSLAGTGGDGYDSVSESLSKLDAHCSKAADTNDSNAHFGAFLRGTPMSEWVVHGNTSAHDGSNLLEVHLLRNFDNEVLMHNV